MAASSADAHAFPIYGARYRLLAPLLDADGDLVTGATTPDTEVSLNQGTFADATNEMIEIATASGCYYVDLTSAEMTAKSVGVLLKSATAGMKTTPVFLYPERMPVIRTGTAQAGAASTITLDTGASAIDAAYVGCYVNITNNSPANALGQARMITAYVGSTKVATVEAIWGTNPSSASTFEILVPNTANVASWLMGTPNALTSGRVDSSTGAMAAGVVTAAAVATDAIDADALADGAITAATFAAGAIDAAAIATDAIGSAELAATAVTEIRSLASGTSDSGTTTTMVDAARTEADTDYWKGSVLVMTSGTLLGQARLITAFNAATDTITVDRAFTQAVGTQTYEIWPAGNTYLAETTHTNAVVPSVTTVTGNVNGSVGSVTGAVGSVTGAVGSVGTGGITTATFAAGAINAAAIGTDAITAAKIAADAIGASELAADAVTEIQAAVAAGAVASVTGAVGSVTGNVGGNVVGSVGSVATGGITTASFAAGAINAAAIATDAIGAAEIAADAITEIQAGLATAAALATVQADADDIQARLPAALVSGRIDASVGAMAANVMTAAAAAADLTTELQAGLATSAALVTAQADLDDIQARLPAALVGGRIDASAGAVAANAITAAAIADGAIDRATLAADTGMQSVRSSTAQAGAAGTITLDAGASAVDDFYLDTLVYLTGGTGAGQIRNLTDYVGATNVATVKPAWTTTPDATSTFAILPGASVWDQVTADHLDALSTGASLNAAGSAGDPWATALPGAYGAGTAGKLVGDNVNATISSRATQTSVDTIDDFLDTEVAAIKAQTDQLVFTGSRVDASVGAMAANVMTAAAAAADLTTELQAGLATSAALATVQADTDNLQTRLPAALVLGRMDASVGAMATDTLTAAALDTSAVTEIQAAVAAGSVASVTGAVGSVTGAVGSVTGNVGGNVVGAVGSVTGAVGSVTGAVGSVTGAVGSVTGNVGGNVVGSIGSVATGGITNLSIATDAIGAAEFAQGAADKIWASTSRTLSAFGFSVTVGTNSDKTGYTLSAPGIQAIWDALTSALTTVGSIGKRIADNLDAMIGSRATAATAAAAVWDETLSSHLTGGSTGSALNAAASAGDPWTTMLPGAYTAGSAGQIIGDNLNATVGSRATQTSVDTIDNFLDTEIAAIQAKTDNLPLDPADQSAVEAAVALVAGAVWDEALAGHATAGSSGAALSSAGMAADPWGTPLPGAYAAGTAGNTLGNNLNATVSSRATPAQVASELVDALSVDTYPEPTAMPAATATLADKIGILALSLRNKGVQTETSHELWNDAEDTPIATATVTDVASVLTRSKFTS